MRPGRARSLAATLRPGIEFPWQTGARAGALAARAPRCLSGRTRRAARRKTIRPPPARAGPPAPSRVSPSSPAPAAGGRAENERELMDTARLPTGIGSTSERRSP
jgi:hypothetical protein